MFTRLMFRTTLAVLLLLFLSSCVTQKKKGDLSALGKLYHNTTAKYNGYFNANEIMAAVMLQLEAQHKDNFNQLIPIYRYVNVENPQSVYPDLDEAIKKVSIVVGLHRESQWSDDCYLLMGKAQYLKQDYESAEATFRYLVNEYDPTVKNLKDRKKQAAAESKKKIKSKKEVKKEIKEREKIRTAYNKALKKARKKGIKAPSRSEFAGTKKVESLDEEEIIPEPIPAPTRDQKKSFIKHYPAFREGQLWLVKTLIERDNFETASRYMSDLDEYANFDNALQAHYDAIKAYFFIRKEDYLSAIAHLESAITKEPNRVQKARFAFVHGQLNQMVGQPSKAMSSYQLAYRLNSDPEMDFYAALNIARNTGVEGAEKAKENLEKMLKEQKNAPYEDQIYFALGVLAFQNKQIEEAIKLFTTAIEKSPDPSRNVESYYLLAKINFEKGDYVAAKNYYDNTMQVMSLKDIRYVEVKRMAENLQEIAAYLSIIIEQDSLLKLSEMSDEELKVIASKIKSERKSNNQEPAASQNLDNPLLLGKNPNRTLNTFSSVSAGSSASANTGLTSSFFAYDDKNLKRDQRDFERKWGNRPLTDNWRRLNAISLFDSNIASEEEIQNKEIELVSDEEVMTLIGDLPKSPEEKLTAQLKVQEALFKLGALYRNKLANPQKSVESLRELLKRFPRTNYEPEALYYLYISYIDLGNTDLANTTRKTIVDKYPGTKFAKILTNPNYLAELENEEQRLNRYYDEAYSYFKSGNYQVAYSHVTEARNTFGIQNKYQAKFALLGAMCLGNLEGENEYKMALREIVGKYPNSEEQSRAREILRLLGDAIVALPGNAKVDAQRFKDEADQIHYIVIAMPDNNNILNDAKISISNYHLKFHKNDKLRISNLYLGSDESNRFPLLVIRRFENKEDAMKYYLGVQRNSKGFIADKVAYTIYPISQNNYREILRSKSLDGYQEFFTSFYY
jgi:tetratricopeptide (TPR) repeat protein